MKNSQRNRKILALYGKKSYGMIALQLGISRNTVAGVVFRHQNAGAISDCSPNSNGCNKVGTGYRTGRPARKTLWPTSKGASA